MPSAESGSITQFIEQLQGGDARAAEELWLRFFPRMLGLARRTLAQRVQRAADADDAVQSAFFSFYERVSRGAFREVLRRDELWNLLAMMTVRKSRNLVRHERAAKRGGGAVLDEAALRGDRDPGRELEEQIACLPAQEFDLRCEELLSMLDDELRVFALLRLLGYRNREIADELGCTERKVERKIQRIRVEWENGLSD